MIILRMDPPFQECREGKRSQIYADFLRPNTICSSYSQFKVMSEFRVCVMLLHVCSPLSSTLSYSTVYVKLTKYLSKSPVRQNSQ
jgi:hypothetical protein